MDETAFQLAITNKELKRKEKELEERLTEVMALRSLKRQQRDPQEKFTCLLTAVQNPRNLSGNCDTERDATPGS